MRFLVAFLAILGYASASWIAPIGLGVNPGDAQAAVIDARARARDNAQAWTDAARLSLDINRNINENLLWNNLAVAQNQAAVVSAAVTGRHAVAPGVAPIGIGAPLINGLAAPLGLGAWSGLGLRGWV